MQFNAVVLALAAFASVAMAAPKADHPFPKIDEVEKLFPGAKASFNNMAAGQLKERAISGCLYHGKDTCIQCNATCSNIHDTGGFIGCMLYCYEGSNCCK